MCGILLTHNHKKYSLFTTSCFGLHGNQVQSKIKKMAFLADRKFKKIAIF